MRPAVLLSLLSLLVVLVGCGGPSTADAGPSDDAHASIDAVSRADAASADDASSTTEDARPVVCDLLAQTGCADDEKCTLIDDEGNRRGCVTLRGSVAEGEVCARGDEGFGHDDCAPGSTCTFIGVLPPAAGGARRCRRLCEDDATCGSGQRCARLTSEAPAAGFCGPTCTPFGDDCEAPLECTRAWNAVDRDQPFFASCRLPGDVEEGHSCVPNDEDCAAGLVCAEIVAGGGVCARPCDDTHPCPTGACTEVDPSIGLCLGS